MKNIEEDVVNSPSHYKTDKIEAIEVIEAFGLPYHLGNVLKYVLRAGRKTNNPLTDLRKAVWYLNRFIFLLESKGEQLQLSLPERTNLRVIEDERLGDRSRIDEVITTDGKGSPISIPSVNYDIQKAMWWNSAHDRQATKQEIMDRLNHDTELIKQDRNDFLADLKMSKVHD